MKFLEIQNINFKLDLWFSITKALELLVKWPLNWTYDMTLERPFQRLQCFLQKLLNHNLYVGIINPQGCGIHKLTKRVKKKNLSWKFQNFCHFYQTLVVSCKIYYIKKVVVLLQVWVVMCFVNLVSLCTILVSTCNNHSIFGVVKVDLTLNSCILVLI